MSNYGALSGIFSGLTNTYSVLASQYKDKDGVTLENLLDAQGKTDNVNILNSSFASYLQNNFASIDKNNDGKISSEEMSKLTSTMSAQGLTKEQFTQLALSGNSGLSTATINNILEHFEDMDTNGDGRITSGEIAAYDVDSARQEKVDEFAYKAATNMSTFYGDESSSEPSSYSMLSYRYKKSDS
ncbi:EF-hand domain-containing protein [bacterium]|uniref:EF-hand domain-containing protein n=1 Tax=Candidatus Scatenecus faecavium TaxID=2840915 RepID=A0A9D1K4R1_9BACT|nr:EF-hand domain-containing protein [bacterium]HIS82614.1 EF-hand domain-containing protein [Candidatus Scatenecus faecavium]